MTIQYRLGALGFLYLQELSDGNSDWPANLGLYDQIAALEWVRDEIAEFGGDPSSVTVCGQSAGSVSVGALLAAPRARGLFRRAVLQSGPPIGIDPAAATPVAEALLHALSLPVTEIARLRDIPAARILATEERCKASPGKRPLGLPFLPVVDGDLLPRHPMEAVRAGASADVSLLVGSNLDEMTPFLFLEPDLANMDEAALLRRCEEIIPGGASREVVEVYRRARAARGVPSTPWALWLAISADRFVRHPSMRLLALQHAFTTDTYAYLFTWASPFMEGMLGACHGLEVPFVFGTLDPLMVMTGNGPDARLLADRVQDAWISFAHTGNPGHSGLPAWDEYAVTHRGTMLLGRECELQSAPYEEERRLWDPLLA